MEEITLIKQSWVLTKIIILQLYKLKHLQIWEPICSDFGVFIPTYAGTAMLTGCYKIAKAYANIKGVFTNTNPVDAYRGAGRPEAAYLIERLIDKSAKELNINPLELRKINLIDKVDMPYKTALGHTYDSGDFKKTL